MKYLFTVSVVLLALAGNIFAQDTSPAELKNEGNDALKNQNYEKALELFEQAIANWDEEEAMDAPMVYNTATCARRIEAYDKAIQYYEMSKDLEFREDLASYYFAFCLTKQGKEDEMETYLVDAIEQYQSSKYLVHMKMMLVKHYMKKGSEPYNEASQILASAQNADPSQYDEITSRANEAFAKAKPRYVKVLEYDPDNEDAKSILKEINNRLEEETEE
jgi:tetratricopeptide (TPR) repeat protein